MDLYVTVCNDAMHLAQRNTKINNYKCVAQNWEITKREIKMSMR